MGRIEDVIAEAVNAAAFEYENDKCYKYAEFTYGDKSGNITVTFEWHSVEDWQRFDWGPSLVQTDEVVDEIQSVAVECCDDITGEDVPVDTKYISEKIEL